MQRKSWLAVGTRFIFFNTLVNRGVQKLDGAGGTQRRSSVFLPEVVADGFPEEVPSQMSLKIQKGVREANKGGWML